MRLRKRPAPAPAPGLPQPTAPGPDVQAAVAAVPGWFHSIDVGGGVITPGHKSNDTLPGKQGFDTARRLLGSRVESVVGDFMTMDLSALGRFDVVLFLGVLYHLREPFEALRRLATVTGGLAVVESVCAVVPGMEHHAIAEFLESDELNGDPTNWWAPNRKALMAFARAAGFGRVECPVAPPPDAVPVDYEWHYGRAVMHARK